MREPDGLAMSSRNVYLDERQRKAAPAVYQALLELRQLHAAGEVRAEELREAAMRALRAEPLFSPEYVSLSSCVDGEEVEILPPLGQATGPGHMAAVAVKVGTTRLIDNIVLK